MRLRVQTLSHFTAATFATLFLATAGAVAQTQPPPSPEQSAITGTITGRVVNESGQALPNATVTARPIDVQGPGQTTTTDHEGNFAFTGLQRGPKYAVSASMPAHHMARRGPNNPQKDYYQVGDSATLMLARGGVITGKVTTPDGEPVVAIAVKFEVSRDGSGRRSSFGMYRETSTDDRGIYRIYGLPPATYLVVAGGSHDYSQRGISAYASNVPIYAPSSTRATATEITVREGEEITDVDIRYRYELGRLISGIARGSAGETTGFQVFLSSIGDGNLQGNESTYQQSGNNEQFVFNGIPDGDYYLTATSNAPDGEMTISESKLIMVKGADVTGVELLTQPMGSVSGRVLLEETKAVECTNKSRPVFTDIAVSAWHKEQEAAKDRPQFIWTFGAPAKADAQGNVTLRNLAAGDYRFATQFTARDWYLQSISLLPSKTPPARSIDAARNWTRVKQGDRLTGLTITLAQGAASFSGQVKLGEGETVTDKLIVYLVPAERADDVLRFYAAAVPANGRVDFTNLAPGRYWILVQPPIDGANSPLPRLRLPDAHEIRLRLRRAAEAAKTEIELKPCQNLVDFQLR